MPYGQSSASLEGRQLKFRTSQGAGTNKDGKRGALPDTTYRAKASSDWTISSSLSSGG